MIGARKIHLVLKYHWYDSIENGSKTHEYREYTDYWVKRLYPLEQLGIVEFQRGYSKYPPKMLSLSGVLVLHSLADLL